MGCALVEERMIEFSLGQLDEDSGTAVESHLLTCQSCLRSFLTVKRAFDAASRSEERPSAATRVGLRAMFLNDGRLAATVKRRPMLIAVCALAAAVLLLVFGYQRFSTSSGPVGPAGETGRAHASYGYPIDSANESPLNLNKL